MSDKNLEHIKKLIDTMQSGLVELFDQLHEIRRQLDLTGDNSESGSVLSPAPLFSGISPTPSSSPTTTGTESSTESPPTEPKDPPLTNDAVARVLDPITHELQTGEAPAEVIAEYLQAAKDYLVNEGLSNDKVADDMGVVLKFLRARGNKGIRPEERDNILERIRRWKAHITT